MPHSSSRSGVSTDRTDRTTQADKAAIDHCRRVFGNRQTTLVDEIPPSTWRNWDCSDEFAVHTDPRPCDDT